MSEIQIAKVVEIYKQFVKFGVFPVVSVEKLREFAINFQKDLEEMWVEDEGKYRADMLYMFRDVADSKQTRLLDLSDWWFDVGEECEYYYKNALGLPDEVHTDTPMSGQANKIEVICGNTKIVMSYKDLDTTKRFGVCYGINAINHLAAELNSPRKYVEIVDRGEDFALYAGIENEKIAEFTSVVEGLFFVPSMSNSQAEVEKQIEK
jgi:hypothetical protein